MKRRFCKEHSILLIEIPYTAKKIDDYLKFLVKKKMVV